MKIRKFSVALVASALAVTGLATPTASALDLEVSGDICTISESYDGETIDFIKDFRGVGDKMIAELKEKLDNDDIADIDLLLTMDTFEGEEFMLLFQRLQTAGLNSGFSEGEAYGLAMMAKAIKVDPELPQVVYEDTSITRAAAAEHLVELKEERRRFDTGQFEDGAFLWTLSATGEAVAAPLKSFWTTMLDGQISLFQACADGKDGSFPLADGGDPGTGGNNPGTGGGQGQPEDSSQRSFGSSR